MYLPPEDPLHKRLTERGESVSTRESLENTGYLPWFDDIDVACKKIDRWCADRLQQVDWQLVFCDNGAGACVHGEITPIKPVVLRAPWFAGLLKDQVNDFKANGPMWLGETVLGVDSLTFLFAVLVYFHELSHLIRGHIRFLVAYPNSCSGTRRALEMDADVFGATKAYEFLRPILTRQSELAAQMLVFWKLNMLKGRSHPSAMDRLVFLTASLASLGRLDDAGGTLPGREDDVAKTTELLMTTIIQLEKRINIDLSDATKRDQFMQAVAASVTSPTRRAWFSIEPKLKKYYYPQRDA
jgi:hypothetical protein